MNTLSINAHKALQPLRLVGQLCDRQGIFYGLVALTIFTLSLTAAHAGNGGNDVFGQAETTLVGYLQGSLGIILAITFFAVGVAIGIARQSLFAIVMGIAAAFTMYYGPGVITSIISATTGLHLLAQT